jgi:hypothetical protein
MNKFRTAAIVAIALVDTYTIADRGYAHADRVAHADRGCASERRDRRE